MHVLGLLRPLSTYAAAARSVVQVVAAMAAARGMICHCDRWMSLTRLPNDCGSSVGASGGARVVGVSSSNKGALRRWWRDASRQSQPGREGAEWSGDDE